MSNVVDELNEKLEEARKAGSFFITVTYKKDEVLKHWQGRVEFLDDDMLSSLTELKKLVKDELPNKGKTNGFRMRSVH